MISITSLSN